MMDDHPAMATVLMSMTPQQIMEVTTDQANHNIVQMLRGHKQTIDILARHVIQRNIAKSLEYHVLAGFPPNMRRAQVDSMSRWRMQIS